MICRMTARPRYGFTMVELMIAVTILALFMFVVYQLFIGGSKTAGRAQWINGTVEEMRNALTRLQKELKATSYPTTLFANTILDPTGDPAKAAPFFVQIKKEDEILEPPADGTDLTEIMRWVVCEPEQGNDPGKITYYRLLLGATPQTLVKVGKLVLQSQPYSFKTTPPEHARAGESGFSAKTALSAGEIKDVVHDVEYVKFLVPASLPTAPTDFQPLKIVIRTRYPKDPKVFKENEIMVTPNVGLSIL